MIPKITSNTRQHPRRGHTAQDYLQNEWFRLSILVEVKEGDTMWNRAESQLQDGAGLEKWGEVITNRGSAPAKGQRCECATRDWTQAVQGLCAGLGQLALSCSAWGGRECGKEGCRLRALTLELQDSLMIWEPVTRQPLVLSTQADRCPCRGLQAAWP